MTKLRGTRNENSQHAGTVRRISKETCVESRQTHPVMMVGPNARMSPTQLRIEVSVKVLTVPYPIGTCSTTLTVSDPSSHSAGKARRRKRAGLTYAGVEDRELERQFKDV